ncbi:trafficking protein particle complex subunit 8-like isoform X2 [Acanthaster planci]|uniref:Trafficking protein particle complex subunit 8-like isoform X2 n=1 Tax=Acanthaster planci TaxID=133434 RepID=A0A8B7YS78_ACAPL|nr:trafficking protein particle complex subunit 8-like isoform X2 [Acanthaster planci]
MAQCTQSAQEFVQNSFGPTVAVLCSHDAEVLAQKNNLSMVEMIRPFSRLTNEAHIRDPSGQLHPVRNLRLILKEMNQQPLSVSLMRRMLEESVNRCQPPPVDGNRGNVITVGSYDLQIGASTAWYETYRDVFLELLTPSDHEFIHHYVACMLVVSTSHADPMDQFAKLSQQQHFLQHTSKSPYPKWLVPNIFKYYVLVHDNTDGEEEKAEAVYQSMKATYGSHACHLLRINSRSIHTAETTALNSDSSIGMPDPWSQYMNKNAEQMETSVSDIPQSMDDEGFPDRVTEAGPDNLEVEKATNANLLTPDSADDGPNDPSPDAVIIASQENTLNEVIAHPLDQSGDTKRSQENLDLFDSTDSALHSNNKMLNSEGPLQPATKGANVHGACLTLSDHDRLRIFIHEFTVRGLLPYIEKMIRTLNEQLAARKGLHKSIFSATKKWFGGNKQAEKAAITGRDMGGKYLREAPELQMRRLADLAFLVQMYELAYTSYHTAKRDFGNDQAWTHYAGALEMAAVSAFMLGSMQKAYPTHYMDTAVNTYLTSCKRPQFATRAVLMSTEILKARGMYAEAAMEFIRMTGEDSDIRSAIFLEQAAHCFINMRQPMVRKYAFHMILAGHRYSKAGQRKHALRAYWQALQVYKGKGWTLAEDHINFTIGRQSFNLKQLENSTASFKHLLTYQSRQPAAQQGAFFKEYLFVFKQLLTTQSQEGSPQATLPQLPLPVINKPATRVLLTSPRRPQLPDTQMYATSVTFDRIFDPAECEEWQNLEEMAIMVASGQYTLPAGFRPNLQLLHAKTDNSTSPLVVVGEPVTVELVMENPLKVPLTISNLTLRWKFTPVSYEHVNKENPEQQPTVLSNETDILTGKNQPEEVVSTEVIPEVLLAGSEYKPVHLSVIPQQTGELHILGIAYSLAGQQNPNAKDEITVINDSGNRENPDSPLKTNKKGSHHGAGVITVQGGQELDIQGPRLNSTKVERCSIMYGPDRRLDPVVVPPMPLLEAVFTSFPSTLLCGEVCHSVVEFTNKGLSPLQKLLVASNHPELFSFGTSPSPTGQSKTGVYRTVPCVGDKGGSSGECVVEKCNVSHVTEIPLPGGSLPPGESASLPLYVRGPDKSGIHEISMLFYYESAEENPKMRHRTLHHTATIHTSNSISLTSSVCRAHSGESRDTKAKGTSLIISLDIDNMNQVHDSHIIEFSIGQVSCASGTWALECLGPDTLSKEPKISGGESQRMSFKTTKCKHSSSDSTTKEQVTFTSITFGKQVVDSTASPCSDFYFRSTFDPSKQSLEIPPSSKSATPSTMSPTEEAGVALVTDMKSSLEHSIKAGLTLIVLWKAFVVDEEGFHHTLVGQHHIIMETIGSEVTTVQTVRKTREVKQLKLIKEPEKEVSREASPEVMGQLLKYSLQYCEVREHNFSKRRVCTLPVSLNIHNCTSTALEVAIETTDQDNSSAMTDKVPAQPDVLPSTARASSADFTWVGHVAQKLILPPQAPHRAPLHACFSSPGVYNLANIRLLARPAREGAIKFHRSGGERSEFTLQRRLPLSLVTIVGALI